MRANGMRRIGPRAYSPEAEHPRSDASPCAPCPPDVDRTNLLDGVARLVGTNRDSICLDTGARRTALRALSSPLSDPKRRHPNV